MIRRIKAVIFDLDGTLANTLPLCISAFRQSIEPLTGRGVTDEEIIATFGPSEEGTILALAPGHYDEGVAGYLRHYEALHDMCPAPFEGVPQLLAELKQRGMRIAMMTGKGRKSALMSLERFGIMDYFELIETGAPEGWRKPECIRLILDAWSHIANDEAIYVGDAPSDVTACRQVGIPIVAAAWAETAEPEKLVAMQPDEMFYSVADFREWLLQNI